MVLLKEKIIFIHIPKTGGISVEKFFLEKFNYQRSVINLTDGIGKISISSDNSGDGLIPLMHYPLKYIIKEIKSQGYKIDDSWTIFSIVRNPYYKLISELFFLSTLGFIENYHTIPKVNKINYINYKLKDYFTDIDFMNTYHSLHSYPQHKFFDEVDTKYQIFKFEEKLPNIVKQLGFEVDEFPHELNMFKLKNVPRPDYSELFTRNLVELVNEKYQKDFEIFGYEMLEPLDFPE